MSTIVKSNDWRGVPCTMRYKGSLKPVLVGDVVSGDEAKDETIIKGGQAPHKEGSTGYVTTNDGSFYVDTVGARWVPDFEPNAWAVMIRCTKKVMNMTTGKKEWEDWSQATSYSIEHHGDDVAYLMAHGRARLLEQYHSDQECFVKAVHDLHFED